MHLRINARMKSFFMIDCQKYLLNIQSVMPATDPQEHGIKIALKIFRAAAQDVMRSFQVKCFYFDELQYAC